MFPIKRTQVWREQQQAQIESVAWQRLTAFLTQFGGERADPQPVPPWEWRKRDR